MSSPLLPDAQGLPREIGGFRILGKLGEGGMGIVYEAEQQSPRRRVALKVVRGGQFVDEVYLRMFRRETETLARLVHPNIAAIYEAGRTEDGQHFFTMELVAGKSLSAFVRDRLGGERPTTEQLRGRLKLFDTICRRSLDIRVKAFGESNDMAQRSIKLLADLYTDWKKPAQAATYTARLKPAAPAKP